MLSIALQTNPRESSRRGMLAMMEELGGRAWGEGLCSVWQESTALPNRRNQGPQNWYLVLEACIADNLGREASFPEMSDTRATPFGEHSWEAIWSIAFKQIVLGHFTEGSITHLHDPDALGLKEWDESLGGTFFRGPLPLVQGPLWESDVSNGLLIPENCPNTTSFCI